MAKTKQDDQPTTITPPESSDVKLRSHPRASLHIRRSKALGGQLGFFLMAWLSWKSGTDFVHLCLRALLGGLAGYLVVWTAAVYVWRQIAVAEVRVRARVLAERKVAAMEQARSATEQHQATA